MFFLYRLIDLNLECILSCNDNELDCKCIKWCFTCFIRLCSGLGHFWISVFSDNLKLLLRDLDNYVYLF